MLFVRHPIYSGLLLAILGTAVAIGEWRGLIAFALITAGFVLKFKTEEWFMSETFGRAIRPLSRRGAVAHSVCYLKQVNAFKEPLCRQGQ